MARRKKPARSSQTVARLRRRLREAEQTLDAIREGHVEALVVHAPGGEEIFTLRSADQPYRLMVEQMREGALTLAADGMILYCNGRFAELMASPAERITGQMLEQFVEPGEIAKVRGMLVSEGYRAEFQIHTAVGTVIPAQLSSTALNIDGVRTVAVVVTDLTHERAERGLRESNRLKDEFLATLSHELRTPLNVILGWTRMLLNGHLDEAARHHALELIDRNAQAQTKLVNDLVDMSRIATGKLGMEFEPLPIVPAMEAAIEGVRQSAHAKGVAIETSWKVQDAAVLADAGRLQQVFWNLLVNAVKFTEAGGRIVVRVARVDDGIQIEVSDTGIGIDPAFLPHVFDRFRQADSGTTRVYGGLGLGLAIVHDLVRLLGGSIEVHSAGLGCGATFTVSLRESKAASRPADARRAAKPRSLAGYYVMLVEDHEDSRELLVKVLQDSGASVAAFASACDAFSALDRTRPSVIVADIGLPDEDGYSFIRRVRAHTAVAVHSVPAIALTAYATAADRAKALAAGFQHHLGKPIDSGRLVEAVHKVTGRAHRASKRFAASHSPS